MELEQKWNVNPRGLGAWRVAGVRMRGPKAGPSLSPPPPPATHPHSSPSESLLVAPDFPTWNIDRTPHPPPRSGGAKGLPRRSSCLLRQCPGCSPHTRKLGTTPRGWLKCPSNTPNWACPCSLRSPASPCWGVGRAAWVTWRPVTSLTLAPHCRHPPAWALLGVAEAMSPAESRR